MNADDLNDIIMAGNAQFEEWMSEIEMKYNEPLMVLAAAMAVMSTPGDVKKKLPPEVMAVIEQLGIGGQGYAT